VKASAKARRRPDRDTDGEDSLDAVFGALADRTRRRLLAHLAHGPATVTELAAPFAMSLPAVSKHIKVLERSGLVRRTVDGRVHHCELDPAPLGEASRWVERYRAFWDDALAALARYAEAEPEEEQG
jgi:DNA-binding transcriptional ArsR family regulator